MGVVLLVAMVLIIEAEFNYTKRPAPWELQSDTVKQTFSLEKFAGNYYELALHDYTQFLICQAPKCVHSHKVIDYKLR